MQRRQFITLIGGERRRGDRMNKIQAIGTARFGNNCGRSFGWQPIIFGA
jgi:hypothetical protein